MFPSTRRRLCQLLYDRYPPAWSNVYSLIDSSCLAMSRVIDSCKAIPSLMICCADCACYCDRDAENWPCSAGIRNSDHVRGC